MMKKLTRNEKGELRRRCQEAIARVHRFCGKDKTGSDVALALGREPGKRFSADLSRFLDGKALDSWLLAAIESSAL